MAEKILLGLLSILIYFFNFCFSVVTVGNINRENLDFLKKECDANAPMAVPNFKANWFKATEYCHYLGRNLVTVTSAEKQAIVNKILEETDKYGDNSFWIGGSDLADLGNFHWHSTGTRIVWHNWNELLALPTAEDARKDDRCVLLANQTDKRGFKWVVANCWDEYYFVCEQKIGVGSPITFPS